MDPYSFETNASIDCVRYAVDSSHSHIVPAMIESADDSEGDGEEGKAAEQVLRGWLLVVASHQSVSGVYADDDRAVDGVLRSVLVLDTNVDAVGMGTMHRDVLDRDGEDDWSRWANVVVGGDGDDDCCPGPDCAGDCRCHAVTAQWAITGWCWQRARSTRTFHRAQGSLSIRH